MRANLSKATSKPVALVLGVANERSIAWSCVQSFLSQGWDVILTYQDDTRAKKVDALITKQASLSQQQHNVNHILGSFPYDATSSHTDLAQRLTDLLEHDDRSLTSVVHSLAHAPHLKRPLLETSREDFLLAQQISAYSLLEVARSVRPFLISSITPSSTSPSITTLSYVGAVRAVPGYHSMGPAKASLESIVRGLALELGQSQTQEEQLAMATATPIIRVNAVSAGPLSTLSARGGISNFSHWQQQVAQVAPLGQVSATQVAGAVSFLASPLASGITGQTIYVDGGYSIMANAASANGSTSNGTEQR